MGLVSVTTILVSRFMIDLQYVNKISSGLTSSIGSQGDSILFQRVIGSLGETIGIGTMDEDGLQDTTMAENLKEKSTRRACDDSDA